MPGTSNQESAVNDSVRVAVTGAAGQIGYSLLFRIASGAMLGPDQPVELRMLEIPPAMGALDGVMMELDDCAFPLLASRTGTSDPNEAFEGADYALLVGSMPRKAGMERSDLLEANGGIFTTQGKALSDSANPSVRVLVVGNPANTNCLIAMRNAPGIADGQFTAMTRLDHNRAVAQLAGKAGVSVNDVTRMTIWGNHSATQYPDIFHAEVGGHNAAALVDDQAWLEDDFIPAVQQRGAAIINARGASSAASAASAAVDHMRGLVLGHARRRLGVDGHPVHRRLRRPRRHHHLIPGHRLGRPVPRGDRPRARRVQPRPHRSLLGRARRRARHRRRNGPPRLTRPPFSSAGCDERQSQDSVRG